MHQKLNQGDFFGKVSKYIPYCSKVWGLQDFVFWKKSFKDLIENTVKTVILWNIFNI